MPSLSLKDLNEKKVEIAKSILEFVDKSNDESQEWTQEDENNYNQANKDFNAISRQIDFLSRGEEVKKQLEQRREQAEKQKVNTQWVGERYSQESFNEEKRLPRKQVATSQDIDLALRSWLMVGAGLEDQLEDEHKAACKRAGVSPFAKDMFIPYPRKAYHDLKRELRLTNTSTETLKGGELIPRGFSNAWEIAQLTFGAVRESATVLRTDTGNDLIWPTTNDTGNVGALIAEEGAPTGQDIATAAITFVDYKYTSKLVKVSAELLQDAAFDLPAQLGTMLGERIARITNQHFTTGDDSGKPKGIVTASSAGKTAASATAFTADEMIDLLHSVDAAYRVGAKWMMDDLIIAYVRKFKTSDLQYIWQPGLTEGQPDRILGYPVVVNNDMASALTTGQKLVLFGNLAKYYVRDIGGIRLLRLNELYAGNDQVGFVAFSRHDGRMLDAGVAPVKHLVLA